MSNRFHNKFHSHNHHTKPTDRDGLYPDSAYDPIASREAPFKGEFYAEEDITAAGSLSARFQVTAQEGLFHGDVTVKGNLEVLGTTTQLDTLVYATSAFQIENHGTGPALKVTQFGQQPLAHFIDFEGDDVILDNSGFLGLGTDSPNKKLTVVGDISATRHADPTNYGYGHIFNDGNTTTQGRLTVVNQTHLLSSAFISNNLAVNTRTLFVSAGPSGRGRVGINTEVPSEELTVDGDGLINENLTVGIDLNVSRDTKINRNLYVNTKGLVSLSGTDGNSKVGINTLTPNVELAVRGSLSATGNATFNGGLTADGSFYTKSAAKIDGQTTIGTINPTTNPDTNVKVLVHDSDTVVRFNYPNDVIWDTTAEFLTAKNLTANTLPLYKSRYTLENSPLSLNGSTINIAANLSANGTIKSDGNLTAANVFGTILYSDDSNSREWKSVYTTMRNTSATWEEAAAQAGTGGAFNTIKAVSGTWDSTYTTVKANSGSWNALADGVVFRTGSNMTGPLTINPEGDNYSSTALSLTGDINLKGTIVIDTNAVAPVMSLSNPIGYGRLEVGGLSGGYIDFKSPFTDDFDIRVAHDQGTSYIATSGDLYLKTGNSLSALQDRAAFKADGKVGVRTGSPTAYLHVSGSTSVYEATPIAILGGVEINTSNALTSYSGGTRADVTLDLGKVRGTTNVGMARLNFWSQNGIQDASIERRPVISGGVTTGDATNGDFRITNFGAGVLYIDAGAGSDSGTMQLWAGQGSTANPGINGARTGVVLSGGFIGFRNEFVTVKGVSGAQVRLTNNNDPTTTRPVSSSISFRNSVDIIDAEIVNERRSNGNSVLLFRSTTTGVSSIDRTTTAMTINGSFVGINKTTPAAPLDVSGGIISTSGAIRAQQGQPSPNTTTQNAAGYGFADAANTGLFATTSNSISLYAVGNPGLTLENTGTRKIVIGGGETSDNSGNVYIGTTTTGAGEGGGYGRRHLVIRSSSTSGSGGLLELTDGAGGHGIVYRSNTTGLSSGGNLVLDSRMNDSGIVLSCKGTGGITFDTGGRVPFPGQTQINGYSTMIVNHQQVNINGGLFVTLAGAAPRVKPANWGGGVTTFDVYSDGGTIGIGAAGTGVLLAYINNTGHGEFASLYSRGNISTPASVYANAFDATGAITTTSGLVNIFNNSGDSRLEIGASGNVYIDLKKPTSDDFDFRIAHNGNGVNTLECKGDLNIYTTAPDGAYGSLVNRLQISRDGNIAALGSEGAIAISNAGTGARFEVKSAGSGSTNHAAYMLFHRPGVAAARFGLDTDNYLKVGGWTMGNNAYRILHEGLDSFNSNTTARFGSTTASSLQVNGTSNLNGNVNINNYGVLFIGRQDSASEGGQIVLAESNNNTPYWYMDVFDGTNPRFRIFTPVGPNPGEALNITSDRRIGIQRMPDAGIILDASGVIRGTQVIANNSGGQVITGFDSTFASTEMVGPRGAYIDLRQQGGTAFATADNDFSLRIRAFDNSNDIEAPYRDLLIRSNTSGGVNESRITLGSGNKVGIGPAITTPTATLHVGGDVIVASGGIRNNNTATALELYAGTTTSKRAILSLNGSGTSNANGVTITTGTSITSLTINNIGRTALGTGGNALARLHIARSSVNTSLDNHIYLDGTINGTYGWFIDTADFDNENVPFRISARRNNVNTNHLVITNIQGNVGIGPNFDVAATHPSARIHIRGGTSDGIKMSNNTRGVIFRNDDSDFYLLHTAANDPNGSWNNNRPFSFNFATGIVSLAYSGSTQCIVGNNTLLNSKTYKFQVSGDIYATGWIRTEGNNGWVNETYGGGWYMEDTTYVRTYNGRSVYANAFFATGPITTTNGTVNIINNSGDCNLEIGASGNAYIDLKKPTGDDFDFRIAHNGNGDNQLLAKGDLNIWTAPADTSSFVHRLQISRDGNITALGSEGAIAINNAGTGARFEVKSSSAPLLSASSAAYMLFHRPGVAAVRFGLDTDNQLKIGGWTMGNNAYRILHEGMTQIALPSTLTTTSFSIGSNNANKELVIQNKTTSEANINVFVWISTTSSKNVRILTTEMVGDITVGATLLGSKITSVSYSIGTYSGQNAYTVTLAANANQTIAAVGNRGTSVPLTPANAAYVTFANQDSNQNLYIAKFGLDTDNKLKVGMGPQYNLSAFDVSLQGKSTHHENVFAGGQIIGNALVAATRNYYSGKVSPTFSAAVQETFSKKIIIYQDAYSEIANTYQDIDLYELLPELQPWASDYPQYLKITILGYVTRIDADNLAVPNAYELTWGAYSYYEGLIRKVQNSSGYFASTLNDDTNGISMGWTRYSSGIPSTTAPSVLITAATSTADGYLGLRLYSTNNAATSRYTYYTGYAIELELINI